MQFKFTNEKFQKISTSPHPHPPPPPSLSLGIFILGHFTYLTTIFSKSNLKKNRNTLIPESFFNKQLQIEDRASFVDLTFAKREESRKSAPVAPVKAIYSVIFEANYNIRLKHYSPCHCPALAFDTIPGSSSYRKPELKLACFLRLLFSLSGVFG